MEKGLIVLAQHKERSGAAIGQAYTGLPMPPPGIGGWHEVACPVCSENGHEPRPASGCRPGMHRERKRNPAPSGPAERERALVARGAAARELATLFISDERASPVKRASEEAV
ncbi:MAG: hypothetical protein AMXMBFR58_20240 [Phycisphaerae bacterium]